jgi:DTW domain-containing protein
MGRRSNTRLRCPRCRLHQVLCLCAAIPRIDTRTRLVLVMHRFEARKTTNTGRLASECLSNSQVILRGEQGEPSQALDLDPERLTLLLFPHPSATVLRSAIGERP